MKTKKTILEAGTGVGNTAKLLSSNSQSTVFAIDASESIEFAYKKYGKIQNIHFLQADIRKLPFKKNFFDFICSDQVLHHTKDTESSFKMLSKLLVKKGIISIYVYRKKGPMREFADDFIRKTTIKMSEKQCMEFSKNMAELGKSLSQIKKKVTEKKFSLIPIKLFINERGFAKIEIGLGKGKKEYDKREDIKQRDISRKIREDL